MAKPQTTDKASPERVSIPTAELRTGVHRDSIYRWVKAGKLKRRGGLVDLHQVEKLKTRHRTGRPCGISELERIYLVRDAEALAGPFLHGERGLVMFVAVARKVLEAHRVPAARRKAFRTLLGDLYAAV